MKPFAETTGRSLPVHGQRARMRVARAAQSPGALAGMMLVYIVIVVGRIGDVIPLISAVPVAKIVVAIAVLVAIQTRSEMAPTRVWDFVPARLTLLIMLLATVSILFSVLRSGTLGVITGTVLSVSVGLVLMIKSAKNWPATRMLLFGCVLSALILAAAADKTSYAGRAGEISSLDPNDFAFVLDGLLPIAITFALNSRAVKKLCYLAASMWIVLSILLTQSRGGLLGLIAGCLAMIFILPSKRHGSLTRHPSALTVSMRALVLILTAGFAWHSLPSTVRTRLGTITAVHSDKSMKAESDGRFTIWEATLPLSLRRPWGWGAGAFATVDGMYAGGKWKAPHNTLLQALIELGFLGLWLLLATVSTSIQSLAREAWAPPGNDDQDSLEKRAFARALIASLVALCVSGFFLSELYSQTLWTIVILSCLVGRPRNTSGVQDRSRGGDAPRISGLRRR